VADLPKNDDESGFSWSNPDAEETRALETRLAEHPGKRLHGRLRDLQRIFAAWAGFSLSLSALLHRCETDEAIARELMRNVGDQSGKERIVRALDQATVAYVAGIGAVIDHARNISRTQTDLVREQYEERSRELLRTVEGAAFLGKLRNYVLHNIAAPWFFSGEFTTDPPSSTTIIALDVEALLSDKNTWGADARKFLVESGDRVQLSPLLGPYLAAMSDHLRQFNDDVASSNRHLFDEASDLARRINLLLTGGATDGSDWAARVEHMQENTRRADRGEPQINYVTGEPFPDDKGAA
jgi:hypothetical protein